MEKLVGVHLSLVVLVAVLRNDNDEYGGKPYLVYIGVSNEVAKLFYEHLSLVAIIEVLTYVVEILESTLLGLEIF